MGILHEKVGLEKQKVVGMSPQTTAVTEDLEPDSSRR